MTLKSALTVSLWFAFSFSDSAARNEESRGQRRLPTCPKSLIKISPREPGHEPWTHAPHCADTGAGDNKLCVYTDDNYHFGDGLSIVARPEVVEDMVEKGLLRDSANDIPRKEKTRKYEQVETPGAGIGLFVKAGEKISAGEVLMVDYPTMIIPSGSIDSMNPNDISNLRWRALLQLSDDTRSRTRALAQSKPVYFDEIVNIFETNAFTHKKGGALHDIIFPEASRMNHNCLPNVLTKTNQTTLAMEVVALRDILAGEEIFNSYLDPMSPSTSDERRKDLLAWSFTCSCPICAGDKVKESDKRRRRIADVQKRLEMARGDAVNILKHAKQLLTLMDEEGMIMSKGDYYELAARGSKIIGRKKEALQYGVKALAHWDMLFGEASRESKAMHDFLGELNAGK